MARSLKQNRVRIIGGEWRGRYLRFADADGLRPSADRLRETLFNWLAAEVVGSCCLDLFAGSGALGFEAASRGAETVKMVEQNPRVFGQLVSEATALGALKKVQLLQADAMQELASPELLRTAPYDLVFVDPPFSHGLHTRVLEHLAAPGWLADNALVYLETAATEMPDPIPAPWRQYKYKRAGAVAMALLHL